MKTLSPMKKAFTLFIIMLITLHPIWSQEDKENDLIIKYDVISLLGDQVSNSSGVRLGLEVMYSSDRSLAFDVMFVFPCASCTGAYYTIETERTVGFMVSADHRFWLYRADIPISGFHLGPRLAYQFTQSEMSETYDNGTPNNYHVYRHMIGLHAMAGYQFRIVGPIYFNPEIGFGTRYISSRDEGKIGDDPGQHEFPYDKDYESGSKWFPSIDFNLKIGLKL